MTVSLPHNTSAPRLARTWASQQLNPLGLDATTFEGIVLAISELVTNVVTHTESSPTVTLRIHDHDICVEVSDSSEETAAIRDAAPGRPGGWGLRIIEQVADHWGATRQPDGDKIVWFTVAA